MLTVTGRLLGLAFMVVAPLAATAPASAQEDRLRQQLASATARIQQLQAEKVRLEDRIRALESSLNAAEQRADALEASVNRAQSQARDLSAAVEQRANLAAGAQQRVAQAQRQALAARREAAAARSELAALRSETEAMSRNFARYQGLVEIAREKNERLVAIGREIIDALEAQTFGDRVIAREPVTQLYRVKLENEIQAFRRELSDQRFFPQTEVVDTDTPQPEAAPAPVSEDGAAAGGGPQAFAAGGAGS